MERIRTKLSGWLFKLRHAKDKEVIEALVASAVEDTPLALDPKLDWGDNADQFERAGHAEVAVLLRSAQHVVDRMSGYRTGDTTL